METDKVLFGDEIVRLGLNRYAEELESNGLTILGPEVTGVSSELLDRCTEALLEEFTRLTGCPISLEAGPEGELIWPDVDNHPKSVLRPGGGPPPTQMYIHQLLKLNRCFRDLAVNPVVDALIDHLIGSVQDAKARRLSSNNSFVKWHGEFGYGPELGLHVDQALSPLPWGNTSLAANATWCLTDYTREDGALAYVPGSHKKRCHPEQPMAAEQAIAAECPAGSVIVFTGMTWHGAFPKTTRGLRLNVVNYFRHLSVLPQENLRATMQDQPWEDCVNPELLRELIGFDDQFPYSQTSQRIPKLAPG